MNQKWFEVIVTYSDKVSKDGIWAKSLEEARDKAYWKWRNADKREVLNS